MRSKNLSAPPTKEKRSCVGTHHTTIVTPMTERLALIIASLIGIAMLVYFNKSDLLPLLSGTYFGAMLTLGIML